MIAVDEKEKSVLQGHIKDWVDQILRRKNWMGTELANKADVSPSTVLRLMNDKRYTFVPTMDTLRKFAQASGFPVDPKIVEGFDARKRRAIEEAPRSEERRGPGRPRKVVPAPAEGADDHVRDTPVPVLGGQLTKFVPQARTGTLPVKHISSLPRTLQSPYRDGMVVNVLPQLEGDPTAFACYMNDDKLCPFFNQGTLLYASMKRDPMIEDAVLVMRKNGSSLIRILMDVSEAGYVLADASQAKVTIGFDDMEAVAVIVSSVRS